MKNKKFVFLALILLTGIAMIVADFLILLFFDHNFSWIRFRLGIPGLVFIIIYSIVLGRSAAYFNPAFFTGTGEDAFLPQLKKIGAVPIKMIGLNVVLHAAFLGAVFFRTEYLAIDPSIKSPLFLAALSFGMLVGTFTYVACDGLVSRTLAGYNLTRYPRELREDRQELKAMIIPLAAAIMSVIFGCSVALLNIHKTGGESWSGILIPSVVFIICVVILCITLKKNTSVLYTSIIEEMENLSSEQKDLSQRITVCSVDELGTIAGMVNSFCGHLGNGIRDIKDGQKDLSEGGKRLQENASSMADFITRISAAVEQVLTKTQGQKESTNNSSTVIQRIAEHIKTLEESVATQTSGMSQASSSVEQMVGNISSISNVTEKLAAQFKTVGEAATEGSRIQKESGERILEIVQQSQALQEANKIIATIAASTNLLAMNAAIEAAHAGDSGKGFSVVADEIRKLAENSSNESKKIGSELKQIVKTIEHIVKDADASVSAFAEISHRISETDKLVFEVNNAIHEQKTGAGQVMEALRLMNNVNTQVKDGSHEISQSNETMIREIDLLQNSAGDILSNMQEVSGGVKNINSGAREVSDFASAVHSSIQKISVIADEFEV